jgi:hypothetical protein
MSSYRPMVKVMGEWSGNGLRFATYKEALDNAADLHGRWMLVEEFRVDESPDPVNYAWVDGKLQGVKDVKPTQA